MDLILKMKYEASFRPWNSWKGESVSHFWSEGRMPAVSVLRERGSSLAFLADDESVTTDHSFSVSHPSTLVPSRSPKGCSRC